MSIESGAGTSSEGTSAQEARTRALDRAPLWRRIRRFVAVAVLAVLVFFAVCAAFLLAMKAVNPPLTSVQAQRRLESFFRSGPYSKRQQRVPLSSLSIHLSHAVVAAEDGGFFAHNGIDWDEFQKAMESNWKRGTLWRGGSTITQQLVKNLFLTTYAPALRKPFEFTLGPLADLILSKDRILELYLNEIEWGDGIYGAEAAARFYYGIPAAQLSREQAARLAACLPAPRKRKPQNMGWYAEVILGRMNSRGW